MRRRVTSLTKRTPSPDHASRPTAGAADAARSDASSRHVRREAAYHDAWHETARGFARTFRGAGCTLKVFQREPGGVFYCRMGPEDAQRQVSLRTKELREAERLALEYLDACGDSVQQERDEDDGAADPGASSGPAARVVPRPLPDVPPLPLTLLDLACFYVGSNVFRARNKPATQIKVLSQIRVLVAGFGPDTDVSFLDQEQLTGYVLRRRAGGVAYIDVRELSGGRLRCYDRITKEAKPRTVVADLTQLSAMLNWAHQVRCGNRERLLDEHPIEGPMITDRRGAKGEPRPMMEREEVDRLLHTAWDLLQQALERRDEDEALRLRRLLLALLIADVTAERVGGIRQLRRSDFRRHLLAGVPEVRVTWRPGIIKAVRPRISPMPPRESTLVWDLLSALPVVGDGLVFPNRTATGPVSSDDMQDQLRALMLVAGVEHRHGLGWHAFRALWATERRTGDLKAAMVAGGWLDWESFLRYVRVDFDDVRRTVAEVRSGYQLPGVPGPTAETELRRVR